MEKEEPNFQTGREYTIGPKEAEQLCSKGYVFLRIDGKDHDSGEPSIRTYKFLGKWNKQHL